MDNNNYDVMRLEFSVSRDYRPGYDKPIEMDYDLDHIWYLGDENKKPLRNSKEIQQKLRRDKNYRYGKDKENEIEFVFSFITEMEGKHLDGKPVTRTDIANIFNDLESKLPPVPANSRDSDWVNETYTLDILVPVEEKEKEKHSCYLELYPSTQLNNFIQNKDDFLSVIQVGSDEFAYDYEEELTKAAKNIFGEDKVETAIYDYGGDFDLFKILISLVTKNEDEDDRHFYFMDRSDNNLPEKVSVQKCIRMQNYSTDLVKQLYRVYTEE